MITWWYGSGDGVALVVMTRAMSDAIGMAAATVVIVAAAAEGVVVVMVVLK